MKKLFHLLIVLACLLQGTAIAENVVRAYVFHSPTCLKCIAIKKYISSLEEKYPLELKYFNTDKINNYRALLSLEKKYGVTKSEVTEVFFADAAFIGQAQIEAGMEKKIRSLLQQGGSDWPGDLQPDQGKLIEERFASFTLLTILSAGLIDGINPCAFATIVFFVSFLSFAGRGKKEIFIIGSCFTLAVFLTYLLIGLGVFNFMRSLELFFLLSKNIFYAVGVVAFALGVMNLYDYFRFKKGQIKEMTLQLPGFVKKAIHSVIRINKGTSGLPLVSVAITTGFLVSVLESICTGQVYLPTIVFILKTQGIRARAFTFLVLYNLMFILPLAVIFGLTFFGATSEWFGSIMRKNLGLIKVLTALFFFGLGTLLFVM
ncbi:cytochrome c biogenesis CcdA family protein [Candidatus Margulisiibacteriota bacterium]